MISGRHNLWRNYRKSIDTGDLPRALDIARQAISGCLTDGDRRLAGIWQRAASNVLYQQGKYQEAVAEGRHAVRIQPDSYEKALSLISVAAAQTQLSAFRSALAIFGRAARLAQDYPGDIYLWTHLYGARAIAFRRTGKLDRAIVDWEGAAALLIEHGFLWRAAAYINNIGYLFMLGGHLREAEQRVLQSLELVERDPHPHSEAVIYHSLACVYTRMSRLTEAQTFFRRSAKMFEALGDKSQLVGTLIHMAELRGRMQEHDEAHQLALRALDTAIELGSETLIAEARENLKNLTLIQIRPAEHETVKVGRESKYSQKVVRLQDYRGPVSRT